MTEQRRHQVGTPLSFAVGADAVRGVDDGADQLALRRLVPGAQHDPDAAVAGQPREPRPRPGGGRQQLRPGEQHVPPVRLRRRQTRGMGGGSGTGSAAPRFDTKQVGRGVWNLSLV